MTSQRLFADHDLAKRLEHAEGVSNASFVDARAKLEPQSGATRLSVAGAHILFDGIDSPCTQTFGLGMTQLPDTGALDQIESFFTQRGAATHHEICPLAAPELPRVLSQRAYQPIEQSSVLFLDLQQTLPASKNARVTVRQIRQHEIENWVALSANGWSEFAEFATLIKGLARITAMRDGALSFVAEIDGAGVATGSMFIVDGVALLAGASTIPSARQQGAQSALLHARLQWAASQGCDVAMMAAAPGSSSQRNAERNGFRIAYTRTKWMKASS